jgi:hypothetical protein
VKITPEEVGETLAAIWILAVLVCAILAPFVALGMIVSYLWGML